MISKKSQIEHFLISQSVDFVPLSPVESEQVKTDWLATYALRVKKNTGAWIHNGFRWHGFSYGLQSAITGSDAVVGYQKQWPASYVVFNENNDWAYSCTSDRYPDFTSFQADIYVAHHNMKWTMVFTHEQPDLGPYLAFKSENAN